MSRLTDQETSHLAIAMRTPIDTAMQYCEVGEVGKVGGGRSSIIDVGRYEDEESDVGDTTRKDSQRLYLTASLLCEAWFSVHRKTRRPYYTYLICCYDNHDGAAGGRQGRHCPRSSNLL
jgi:hypothetical protein